MTYLRKNLASRRRRPVPRLEESIDALQNWFATPLGQHLLEEEQKVIDQALSCLFGYHLLQMSVHQSMKLYGGSRVCHCFSLGARGPKPSHDVGLYGDFASLPFEDETVDVTLLHHVLDFSENPHQVLREASRVTIARGYIVVVGFNPNSVMGMVKPFAELFSASPVWQRNSLRRSRIADWMKFLDCQVVDKRSGHYVPPMQNQQLLTQTDRFGSLFRRWMLPFGNFYCLVARKDRTAMIPIRPSWSAQSVLIPKPKQAVSARSAAKLSVIRGKPNAPGK